MRRAIALCAVLCVAALSVQAWLPASAQAAVRGCAPNYHYGIIGNKTIFESANGVSLVRTCGPCEYVLKSETISDGLSNTVYETGQFLSGSTSQGCRIGIYVDFYNYGTKQFSTDGGFFTSGSAQWFAGRPIQATGSSKTGWTWEDETLSVYWSGNGGAEVGWLPHDLRMCAPAATGSQTQFCGDGTGNMRNSPRSASESYDTGQPPSNSYDHTPYE